MHWQSFEAFIAMGGYGFYVWTSFGITALCGALEIWQLRGRQQSLVLKETA